MILHRFSLLGLFLALFISTTLPTSDILAAPKKVGPVTVELVAENQSIQPGEPFDIGLYIVPDEQWHVYWKNPGDAGMPPKLKWDLPPGFTASAIQWPAPELIRVEPLASYGYHEDVLYPVTITPPSNLTADDTVTIYLKADWLVCKVECLPGSASVTIELPISTEKPAPHPEWASLFENTKNRFPSPAPEDWQFDLTVDDEYLYLDFIPDIELPTETGFQFFASRKAVIEHAADQPITKLDSIYRMKLKRSSYSLETPDSLSGVLAVDNNGQNNYYDITVSRTGSSMPIAASSHDASIGILTALIFAVIGGLILNLMPCVLPVLSLKVLGLVQQANQGRKAAVIHGLAFTAGVVATFWVIVGLMLALQAGGQQLGWGFQLQSPTFVMILAGFMFLFSLSLFGVYENGFLSSKAGALSSKGHSGLGGAFISGVTATFVATPCTAPFMGAALGFSLTQPPLASFAVYTFLGLGMALPYLLLSAFPALLKFVPKPGAWMETLKQALGFVLAATVIWLGWVLANQSGSLAVIVLMGVLLLLSVAAWIYGRWGGMASSKSSRLISRAAAALIIIFALGIGSTGIASFAPTANETSYKNDSGIAWQKFSSSRLESLISNGQAVFIDFTAAWCLSCQVNERIAFSSEKVQQKFRELNITPLKADWTNRSDEITQALAKYGRNSVPLYVLYLPEKENDPLILPEILTPQIVLDALNKI